MSVDEEYYINLHVGSKFVHDPHVKYLGGKMVRHKEYLDTMSYFELCKIVKDGLGFNTVQLIYFHVLGSRTLQDNLRVVIDTAIFVDDESMLAVACL
ncbi:hypothetical protein Gohar_013574 [Gossypium harknessii]|uniref:PB1-like domain-containing protein n=1 Tax=Gossypium harknessii TaxID=34285 RepID=A0A7J9H0Q6_9ROSI|nr:hypothetical protein [Gossypium harknessii]